MSIQFGAACTDILKTEKKWITILGLALCFLIPIVGPMVMFGFLLRRFSREREGHSAEDFNFDYFGDYLKMGLWPTLATMLFSLILFPVIFTACLAPIALIPLAESGNETIAGIIALFGTLALCLVLALFTIFTYAILLRSGLMMDFKSGFSFPFMTSFTRKVGLSLVGYLFLLYLIAMPLMLVGYLALLVGVYVAAAWMQTAMLHLVFQHYDLMLERGGERIEVNPELTKPLGTPPIPPQQQISHEASSD